ncbi:MAG: glycosyltransferase family 2 protein [Saprospiraceae bacterium]|jgi:glycosyltransferase involved in cell wall biosynthesis|nr:glycosyltransferase family 2 protein [Saprospiraceae bacterium]
MKIGVIIPCYNEENYIGELLQTLSHSIRAYKNSQDILVFVCDNGSEDNTVKIIEDNKTNFSSLILLHENNKGSGLALAKAANAAFANVDWIISMDADCTVPNDWISKWAYALNKNNFPILTGWCKFPDSFEIDFPNTAKLFHRGSTFNNLITKTFGIINICGANHAVSKNFYNKIGGYTQPYIIENNIKKIVAGNDWDFGTKARIAKQEIGFVDVFNETSDRRLTADANSFVEGTAYEGVLNNYRDRVKGIDISEEQMQDLFFKNKLRTVKHFALKPTLSDNSLLKKSEVKEILGIQLTNEIQEWIEANPIKDIYTDRNGFIYGSLEDFHKAFGIKVYNKMNEAGEK